MEKKICKTCGIEKDIIDFPKTKRHYRNECKLCRKEKMKEYNKEYYLEHKDKLSIANKKYKECHEIETKEYNKNYYIKNKEKIINNVNKYQQENKNKIVKRQEEYNKKRMQKDNVFRLKVNIRNTVNRSFTRKKYRKNKRTEQILGCSIDSFIKYILQTYKDKYGYEWDGKEVVHIDHITPLATAKTEEEVFMLCNYTNLQLLKAKDNLIKGSKII